MPRLRTLKPSFFTHEVLAGECSPLERILFAGLWCHADREGRLEDRPRYLKTVILPYDDINIDEALNHLQEKGFIRRYYAKGKRIIAVLKFGDHQKPLSREAESALPPPEEAEVEPAANLD